MISSQGHRHLSSSLCRAFAEDPRSAQVQDLAIWSSWESTFLLDVLFQTMESQHLKNMGFLLIELTAVWPLFEF